MMQPIPDLTDKQAIELNGRNDLPSDIQSQVSAHMIALQMSYYWTPERLVKRERGEVFY